MGMLVADEMTDTANLKCVRSCHVQHDSFITSKSGSRCLYFERYFQIFQIFIIMKC